jgi:hypothetical protein
MRLLSGMQVTHGALIVVSGSGKESLAALRPMSALLCLPSSAQSPNGMKKLLIILGILLIVMFFTNPTKDDFVRFVKKGIEKHAENASMFEKAALLMFSGKISEMVTNFSNRSDYFVCSVITIEMGDEKYHYLGMFKIFVPLQSKTPSPGDFSPQQAL